MNNTINLAFIGSGNWARKYHFPALNYVRTQFADRFDVNLRGIYSLDVEQAKLSQHSTASSRPTTAWMLLCPMRP